MFVGYPAAGAVRPGFHAVALADDDRDVEPDQRSDVGGTAPVGAHDLYRLPDTGERGHDLLDARVASAGIGVDLGQEVRLGGEVDHPERVQVGIERAVGAGGRLGERP